MLNRVRSTSLACAVMCPDAGVDAVATGLKIGALLFAVDDIVDGTRVVPRDDEADSLLITCRDAALSAGRVDLDLRIASLLPPLSSDVITPWRETSAALSVYCSELSALPRAELYYPFFAEMFASAMEGMRNEVVARRTFIESNIVPDYESYLAEGKRSIASPALCAAVLVSLAPEMEPSAFHACADAVREFVLMGGSCIRLANDVRSFAREKDIEQRPNSILVLMRTEALSERDAEEVVVGRANGCLAALVPLAAALPAALQPWAEAVQRFTALIRDWYMVRELHE
jgi:hypothetical protein